MDTRKKLTQKNYSVIAKLYIEDFEKNYENFHFVDDVLRLREIHGLQDYPIVDLGSGPGNVIDYILKRDKSITSIIAVDFIEHFCERMNKKYIQNKNIKIFCEDMFEFVKRQKASSIGIYTASYSFIHIPDWEFADLLKLIHRSLAKKGLLLFSCYRGKNKGMKQDQYQVNRDFRLKHDETLLNYMNYFTEDELRERLKKARLEIVKMEIIPSSGKKGDFENNKIWLIAEKI